MVNWTDVFNATDRFHSLVHAAEWSDPSLDAAYEGVRWLVPAVTRALG